MPSTSSDAARPMAAFQSRDFRFFQLARVFSMLAMQMQGVAVAWQVYQLTGQPLHLGYVGLAQFLPAVAMFLISGHVADRFDRRYVLIAGHSVLTVCAGLLLLFAQSPRPSVVWIYATLAVIGAARAFLGPASQALMPNLVPVQHFSNAVAWSTSIWQVCVVAGPALGGVVYAAGGAGHVYRTVVVLEVIAISVMTLIRQTAEPVVRREASWHELIAGIRFIRQQRAVLGAISLDLFAVLLGGAVALLPVYARDILHVGPQGLGLLRSAPAVGAAIMGLYLAYRPLRRQVGRTMLACVALFGIATVVFGLSTRFWLSLVALGVAGAADMVSVLVRHTLVQMSTPDAMRGRVAAVSLIFIGASNELGEFESGLTAAWFGTVSAVVVGGLGTCLVVALWAWRFPELRRVDRLDAAQSG